MTEDVERKFADPVDKAKARELEAREHFKVSPPKKSGAESEHQVGTRSELAWKEVGGEKTAKVRSVARRYQDRDLRMVNVDIAGRVSRRSSHLQATSLGASKKWPLWSLDIRNAFLEADGLGREVHLRGP